MALKKSGPARKRQTAFEARPPKAPKPAAKPTDRVTLIDHGSGQSIDLPVLSGTLGPKVIDIRKLYAETDMFTYDPGFTSTGSAESAITFIDGEKGVLLHRGYPIEQLAQKSTFLEVAYLLLYGELPNKAQAEEFTHSVIHHTMIHEQVIYLFRGFRRDAHPMSV